MPMSCWEIRKAAPYVDGSAWHCYAGDVGAQNVIHESRPDKSIDFTECSGGRRADNFADNLTWNLSTLIIGATRNFAKTALLWNMRRILFEKMKNGCSIRVSNQMGKEAPCLNTPHQDRGYLQVELIRSFLPEATKL